MSTEVTWTAVFQTVENGWVQARVAELPGVITVAPTRAEAEVGVLDALREYLLSLATPPCDYGEPGEERRLVSVRIAS